MNNIYIETLTGPSDLFDKFKDKAWKEVHFKLHGVELEEEYWDKKKISLAAKEGDEYLGALVGSMMAGVLHISELVVDEPHKKKGVGAKLLESAEKWARENGAHMMYLETGLNWNAKKFYLDNGFEVTADLGEFYSKTAFVLMTKRLV